jgi:hypothetical protein
MNGHGAIWTIVRSSAIGPPEGSVCESAYLVRVERGAAKRELIVEFADCDAVVSNGYAEEVTRGFLRDEEPPQHVIVEISKDVRVVTGPLDPTGDEPGADGVGLYAVDRRARGRRRGYS